MRKIEKEMLDAIADGWNWTKDNTSVEKIDDVNMAVYLFGNEIASVNTRNGFVMPNTTTLANYPTVTTKSRLRALGVDLEQRKGKIFIDGEYVCNTY